MLLIGVAFWIQGCQNSQVSDSWQFESIRPSNELYLIQKNDKYGEWGGDTYLIKVYRERDESPLIIDYIEYQGMPGPPAPPHPDSIPNSYLEWLDQQPVSRSTRNIRASNEHRDMLSSAILELVNLRANNPEYISMAGISNQVISSDSSLIIQDYSSTEWKGFQLLRAKLLEHDIKK